MAEKLRIINDRVSDLGLRGASVGIGSGGIWLECKGAPGTVLRAGVRFLEACIDAEEKKREARRALQRCGRI